MFTCEPSLPPSPEVVSNVILCHVSCLDCPVDYCLVNLLKLKETFDSTNNSGLNSEIFVWSGIFHQAGPISFHSRLGTSWFTPQNASGCLSAVSCFMQRNFTRIHDYFRQNFPWYLPDRLEWFSCDERKVRNFLEKFMQTAQIPAGNSERTVYIFPENQILMFLWRIGN